MTENEPLYEDRDLCYHYSEKGVREIPADRSIDAVNAMAAGDLPFVIHDHESVAVKSWVFRADEEGLYRFFMYPDRVFNRICFRQNIPRFVGSIGQLHLHGWRHNDLPVEELIRRAQSSFVSITCGVISRLAMTLFQREQIDVRPVSSLTLEQWNSYNRGHVLFEYRDPVKGRWMLADPDFGLMFRAEGIWLDLDTVCRKIRTGDSWEAVNVGSGAYRDLCTDAVNAETSFFAMRLTRLDDPAQKLSTVRRLLQVPRIDGYYTVDTQEQRNRFEALCKTTGTDDIFLPTEEFRRRFYSD